MEALDGEEAWLTELGGALSAPACEAIELGASLDESLNVARRMADLTPTEFRRWESKKPRNVVTPPKENPVPHAPRADATPDKKAPGNDPVSKKGFEAPTKRSTLERSNLVTLLATRWKLGEASGKKVSRWPLECHEAINRAHGVTEGKASEPSSPGDSLKGAKARGAKETLKKDLQGKTSRSTILLPDPASVSILEP